ncbi:MAG: nucleotidyl transferase AbiEii/AbiGii toxin family protein [Janthinobacterium lividum]
MLAAQAPAAHLRESAGRPLLFPGGTCLRIVHGNQRFSEDLDFDNSGLRRPSLGS